MDRTAEFLEVVLQRSQQLGVDERARREIAQPRSPWAGGGSTDELETVAASVGRALEELAEYVATQRRRYCDFSTARAMTRDDRDTVDRSVADLVRQTVSQLDMVKDAALARLAAGRQRASARPWGTSAARADDGALEVTFATHILGIVMILNDRLQEISQLADDMRASRFKHEVSNPKSQQPGALPNPQSLLDWGAAQLLGATDTAESPGQTRREIAEETQSLALAQALEEENESLQTEILDTLEQVKQAERTVAEVATLNQLFATKVLEQAHEIEALYDDAMKTGFYVRRGHRELEQMRQGGNKIVYILAAIIVVLSISLVLVDFVS